MSAWAVVAAGGALVAVGGVMMLAGVGSIEVFGTYVRKPGIPIAAVGLIVQAIGMVLAVSRQKKSPTS